MFCLYWAWKQKLQSTNCGGQISYQNTEKIELVPRHCYRWSIYFGLPGNLPESGAWQSPNSWSSRNSVVAVTSPGVSKNVGGCVLHLSLIIYNHAVPGTRLSVPLGISSAAVTLTASGKTLPGQWEMCLTEPSKAGASISLQGESSQHAPEA